VAFPRRSILYDIHMALDAYLNQEAWKTPFTSFPFGRQGRRRNDLMVVSHQ